MKHNQLDFYSIDNPSKNFSLDFETTNLCPRCLSGAHKLEQDGYYVKTSYGYNVYLIEYCPVCNRLSLREFIDVDADYVERQHTLIYSSSRRYPVFENVSSFSEEISNLSPSFVKIYNQAERAEQAGLDEICGMGYRKALEFLVKDYLCSRAPDEEAKQKIANTRLRGAISLIDSDDIKTLADGCATLGNDHCHYLQKHKDYSIQELTSLIRAIVYFIQCKLAVAKAAALSTTK